MHNILRGDYFKRLLQAETLHELLAEIRSNVTHVEPFAAGTARVPSSAFQIVFRLGVFTLSKKQVRSMLRNELSPYIAAVAVLLLRYTASPKELWRWFSPLIEDETPFRDSADASAPPTTLGAWVRGLLTELNYFTTVLPRIPVPVQRDIKARLRVMEQAKVRARENRGLVESLAVGARVKALYSDDMKWYTATVTAPCDEEGRVWVKYDAYGNEEGRTEGYVKLMGGDVSDADDDEYGHWLKVVTAEEASGAAASGKDYADRTTSYKNALSLKMDSFNARGRKSGGRGGAGRGGAGGAGPGSGGGEPPYRRDGGRYGGDSRREWRSDRDAYGRERRPERGHDPRDRRERERARERERDYGRRDDYGGRRGDGGERRRRGDSRSRSRSRSRRRHRSRSRSRSPRHSRSRSPARRHGSGRHSSRSRSRSPSRRHRRSHSRGRSRSPSRNGSSAVPSQVRKVGGLLSKLRSVYGDPTAAKRTTVSSKYGGVAKRY